MNLQQHIAYVMFWSSVHISNPLTRDTVPLWTALLCSRFSGSTPIRTRYRNPSLNAVLRVTLEPSVHARRMQCRVRWHLPELHTP